MDTELLDAQEVLAGADLAGDCDGVGDWATFSNF